MANGIVNIHGKDYMTVAKRVEMFHADNEGDNEGEKVPCDIITDCISHAPVVFKATVNMKKGQFTGYSSVSLDTVKQIEKQNPYEVAETSAVGRALGFAGYGLIEGIASADEMVKAGADMRRGCRSSAPA